MNHYYYSGIYKKIFYIKNRHFLNINFVTANFSAIQRYLHKSPNKVVHSNHVIIFYIRRCTIYNRNKIDYSYNKKKLLFTLLLSINILVDNFSKFYFIRQILTDKLCVSDRNEHVLCKLHLHFIDITYRII